MFLSKWLDKQQKQTDTYSTIQLPHSSSARPLKGGEISIKTFPDLQSTELKTSKDLDKVGEIRNELAKNKNVRFNQTLERTMDELPGGGDISPILIKSHKVMKVTQFKKTETEIEMAETSKTQQKSAGLTKTIMINSPVFNNYESEKSVAMTRFDSGKSRILFSNNSKGMDSTNFGEIKTERNSPTKIQNLETSNGFTLAE